MSAPGSGPYEGTGEDAGRARPPARGQGPLVQVPFGPLVQGDATDRAPRVEFSAVIDKVAERLGLDPATLEGPCPLPGHTGRARLASGLPEDPTGDVRLLCCRARWRSLGEVYAAIGYGYDTRRTNVEILTWNRRLAHDVGAFRPAPVAVPPLPSGASPAIEAARDGFRLLAGIRWADRDQFALPYSVRFAGAWCGLTHGTAHEAIRTLVREGIIREVGRPRGLPLYLPGPMPEEAAGADEASATDEDALIARFIEAFDAEELPADSPNDGEARP